MKKKNFAILLCMITIMTCCLFPFRVGAEELTTPEYTDGPAMEEQPATPETEAFKLSAPEESESSYHTLFTRVWEFLCKYPEETASVAGSLILVVLNLLLKHSWSKSAKDTKENLKAIKGEVAETLGGQKSVVDITNKMIDGYNALSQSYDTMKEAYDQYGAIEGERNRVVGAVLATNSAILEILSAVYINSKNLPQGVKDLVTLKYANCLKTLEDDKQLIAIVEAVRNNIGSGARSTDSPPEPTESTEV